MQQTRKLIRPVIIALIVAACGSGSSYYDGYYDGPHYWGPNRYPWWYTSYGTYTVVHRRLHIVDGWAGRTFDRPTYRGYAVRRHNSPVIKYRATKEDQTIEVDLTPKGDSTQVEVRIRSGKKNWDKEQAKELQSLILAELDQNR